MALTKLTADRLRLLLEQQRAPLFAPQQAQQLRGLLAGNPLLDDWQTPVLGPPQGPTGAVFATATSRSPLSPESLATWQRQMQARAQSGPMIGGGTYSTAPLAQRPLPPWKTPAGWFARRLARLPQIKLVRR